MEITDVKDVLGQYQPSSRALLVRFRGTTRSVHQQNPDPTRDSLDLQPEFDNVELAEPAKEQDFQSTAEFEPTASTTGETVSNITMSGAPICDVAGRTKA